MQGYRFKSDTVTPVRYREVIHAPLWVLLIIYFFLLSIVISVWAALGDSAAQITFGIVTLLLIIFYFRTALVIEVDDKEFRVGNAHIEHRYRGKALALDNQAIRRVRTRDADPQAFLAIRFWVGEGVQLFVNDSRDTTPYWLISTKNGLDLIKALNNEEN